MEVKKLKKETVDKIRKVKKENELTYEQIIEMLEAKDYYLSEATLKRVFSENSDPCSFRYKDTIAPLADVLLDLYIDTTGSNDVESLKNKIHDKNMTISILANKNEELRADFERRIAHLKEQINCLEKHLAFREKVVDQKDIELSKKDDIIFKLLNMIEK